MRAKNMYLFSDRIDCRGFFMFDKKLITDGRYATWTPSAKAVYPVLRSFGNDKGEAFPEELTLAVLSGKTDKTVRDGLGHLAEDGVIKITHFTTKRGHRANRYKFELPPVEQGRSFPFRRCVFEGGNWLRLSPTGQALYPVMRCYGGYTYNEHFEDVEPEEDPVTNPAEFPSIYAARDFDFCSADLHVLAESAGIHRTSLSAGIKSLQDNFLVEYADDPDEYENPRWKVFLTPPKYWKAEYLNRLTRESFAHLFNRQREEKWKRLPVESDRYTCNDAAVTPVQDACVTEESRTDTGEANA